jgi:hypothetical protein
MRRSVYARIMAPDPISAAYFIHPSHLSACLYVYLISLLGNSLVKDFLVVCRKRLANNVTAAVDTQKTIAALLYALFCMRSVL